MLTILVSVSDKTGLDKFLKRLERFDTLKLIATRSTSKFLEEHGFACTTVEELTKFPEILSGRVKTLHPKVLGGILSRPSVEDRNVLSQMDIPEIDMVVVNLYPFEAKLKEGLSEPEMVEHIDVGGVTLLRAAAKNFQRVAVVCHPDEYDLVIENMDANGGQMTVAARKMLAYNAFQKSSGYDQQIASYFARQVAAGELDLEIPELIDIRLSQHEALRYGENPHQAAGWYQDDAGRFPDFKSFPPFEQLQGKEISANNITDVYALVRILRELTGPAACIIKHNNPCGVALGRTLAEAFEKAHACDPLSAFGGIYGVTGRIDGALAKRIIEGFVEVVVAPGFEPEALDAFRRRKNLRVLRIEPAVLHPSHFGAWKVKDLQEFGWIVEKETEPPVTPLQFKCIVGTPPGPDLLPDIGFAWSVVKHLTSNAIFIARHGSSIGFGMGQTSRIAAVKHALAQAGDKAAGAIMASDAFFPAVDNIEAAAKAGISLIIQPGGSVKDEDVIAECAKAGITMLFTGQRGFRH